MPEHSNKAAARRLFEDAISSGDFTAILGFFAPEGVDLSSGDASRETRERTTRFVASVLSALPDLQLSIEDMIAEGDKVVVRASIRGTYHPGASRLSGPARRVAFEAVTILRFSEGEIVEHWGTGQYLSLMQQIGATVSRVA